MSISNAAMSCFDLPIGHCLTSLDQHVCATFISASTIDRSNARLIEQD